MKFDFSHQDWLALLFAATAAKDAIPLGSWGKRLETTIEEIVHDAVKCGFHKNGMILAAPLDAANTRTLYKIASNAGAVIEKSRFSREANKAMIAVLMNLPKLAPERKCHNCSAIIPPVGPSRCKACLRKQRSRK